MELKLKQLHRGYVLTDFEGNEVGIKDTNQAMEEIRKLLKFDEKSEESILEQKTKPNHIELHRMIFDAAKGQINIYGKVNGAKIARELNVNNSTVHSHLRKMNLELEDLIKKWQEERDKKMVHTETRVSSDNSDSDSQTQTKEVEEV